MDQRIVGIGMGNVALQLAVSFVEPDLDVRGRRFRFTAGRCAPSPPLTEWGRRRRAASGGARDGTPAASATDPPDPCDGPAAVTDWGRVFAATHLLVDTVNAFACRTVGGRQVLCHEARSAVIRAGAGAPHEPGLGPA